MTEKSRSKNWLSNKNLLKTSAIIAIGAAALTGCSKASGEAVPTPTPTEQTQTQTPPTTEVTPPTTPETTPPETTSPSETETATVIELNLSDSKLYKDLSSADKKIVDAADLASVEQFKELDSDERSLFALVAMDAGSKDYFDRMSDVSINKTVLGEAPTDTGETINLPEYYYKKALSINPNKISKDESKMEFDKLGWVLDENAPMLYTRLGEAIAFNIAAEAGSKYHPNVDAAAKILYGLNERVDNADEMVEQLETVYNDAYDPGYITRFPLDIPYARGLEALPGRIRSTFEEIQPDGQYGWTYMYPADPVTIGDKKIYTPFKLDPITSPDGDGINRVTPYI